MSLSTCIEHHGKPRPNGYVRITVNYKSWYAHRYAWFYHFGEIPEGMDVCHKCDNRRCHNIDHLFLGTRKDNMQDAKNKKRTASGFKLPQTKLSEEQKMEIVELAKTGMYYKDIASKFNISRTRAGKIALEHGVRRT
jgi:uncharacterized UBP type Zn finger protein